MQIVQFLSFALLAAATPLDSREPHNDNKGSCSDTKCYKALEYGDSHGDPHVTTIASRDCSSYQRATATPCPATQTVTKDKACYTVTTTVGKAMATPKVKRHEAHFEKRTGKCENVSKPDRLPEYAKKDCKGQDFAQACSCLGIQTTTTTLAKSTVTKTSERCTTTTVTVQPTTTKSITTISTTKATTLTTSQATTTKSTTTTCASGTPYPTDVNGRHCTVTKNIDRPGGDLPGKSKYTGSFDECVAYCASLPQCQSAQYHKDNGYCYVKDNQNPAVVDCNDDTVDCGPAPTTTASTTKSTTASTTKSTTAAITTTSSTSCDVTKYETVTVTTTGLTVTVTGFLTVTIDPVTLKKRIVTTTPSLPSVPTTTPSLPPVPTTTPSLPPIPTTTPKISTTTSASTKAPVTCYETETKTVPAIPITVTVTSTVSVPKPTTTTKSTTKIITTPIITTPVITTPVITTPVITTPVITTPIITTPIITTPVITTPVITTPVITTPTTTPSTTTSSRAPVTTCAAVSEEFCSSDASGGCFCGTRFDNGQPTCFSTGYCKNDASASNPACSTDAECAARGEGNVCLYDMYGFCPGGRLCGDTTGCNQAPIKRDFIFGAMLRR